MTEQRNFDVIVIGAGVVGCSIAHHLTKAGFKTALIEQGQVGAGASGANFGMVMSNDVELKHSIPMVTTSFRRFENLEAELGMPFGFRRIASLRLLANEAQWQASTERAAILTKAGISYEFVPPERIRELEPMVNPDGLFGASYCSGQAQLNPFLFMWAYLRKAIASELVLHSYTKVTGFDIRSGKIHGVKTSKGKFNAGMVVLATAAWTRQLGKIIGYDWNIHTFRASAMVTEPVHQLNLKTVVTTADHIELPVSSPEDAELTVLALSQTPDGHFLIAQADRPGEVQNPAISHVAPQAMATMAGRYFPVLRQARLLRTWTAPTTFTDDGMPLLGFVNDLEGLLLAASFRSAIINTPIAGEIVTQLISSGHCDVIDITPFAPQRIMKQAETYYTVKSSSTDKNS